MGSTTGVVFVGISTFGFFSLTVVVTGGTGAGAVTALGDSGIATGFSTTVVIAVDVAAGAGTGLATSLVGAVGAFSETATSPMGFAVTLVSGFFPETIIGGAVGTGGFVWTGAGLGTSTICAGGVGSGGNLTGATSVLTV